MNIFLTGASGFVGSEFLKYVKNKKVFIPNNIKKYGKDKRYLYVAKLLKRYINAINNNTRFKPNHLDGLKNLMWLDKIEKI